MEGSSTGMSRGIPTRIKLDSRCFAFGQWIRKGKVSFISKLWISILPVYVLCMDDMKLAFAFRCKDSLFILWILQVKF